MPPEKQVPIALTALRSKQRTCQHPVGERRQHDYAGRKDGQEHTDAEDLARCQMG